VVASNGASREKSRLYLTWQLERDAINPGMHEGGHSRCYYRRERCAIERSAYLAWMIPRVSAAACCHLVVSRSKKRAQIIKGTRHPKGGGPLTF